MVIRDDKAETLVRIQLPSPKNNDGMVKRYHAAIRITLRSATREERLLPTW